MRSPPGPPLPLHRSAADLPARIATPRRAASAMSAALLATLLASGCAPGAPRTTPGDASASVHAANALTAALHDSVRAEASFPFESPERRHWEFVPIARKGVPFKRMRADERDAAHQLLRAGLSEEGYRKAVAIAANESRLGALEAASGAPSRHARDPELYFTSIFGTPRAGGVWGWRFEGHHLSVNVTEIGPHRIVAPVFMGSNPGRVPSGPDAGLRLLGEEEDMGRALLAMLTPEQRREAVLADTTYGEILTRNDPVARPVPLAGVAASAMTQAQQRQLRALVELYAGRMAPAAARAQLARIDAAGFGALRFAWAGGDRPGVKHYYRIHGPTVLIEYDNSQNNANHVHTVWRDLEHDFGGDLLRRHYAHHGDARGGADHSH